MRPALIGVGLVAMLALAGCSSHLAASVAATTAPVSTPAPAPTASASASPDPLASLDSTLAQVDGAVNQSQQDASVGDASAAQNDSQ